MREKTFPSPLTHNWTHHNMVFSWTPHYIAVFGCFCVPLAWWVTAFFPSAHLQDPEHIIHSKYGPAILLSTSFRPRIAVQCPVQAPTFLVHGLFPSFISWALQWITCIWGGYKAVEISSIHIPLELPFCLRWCERCTEQWKTKIKYLLCPAKGCHFPRHAIGYSSIRIATCLLWRYRNKILKLSQCKMRLKCFIRKLLFF